MSGVGGGEDIPDWASVGGTESEAGGVGDAGGLGDAGGVGDAGGLVVSVSGVVGAAGVVGVFKFAPNCPDWIMFRRLGRSRPGKRVWSCDSKVSRFGMSGSPLACFRRLGAASRPCKESPCQFME